MHPHPPPPALALELEAVEVEPPAVLDPLAPGTVDPLVLPLPNCEIVVLLTMLQPL